jgi:hypothetical protein
VARGDTAPRRKPAASGPSGASSEIALRAQPWADANPTLGYPFAQVSRQQSGEHHRYPTRGGEMTNGGTPESGTKDKNYDLITVAQLCLEHVWRLDQYAQDAERDGDDELAQLFRRMQEHSRRGGEECKRLLRERLQQD